MYKRKTTDEWQIHVNYGYGHGYEEVTAADNYTDARQLWKDYRANSPEYPAKIVLKRIKIKDTA